MVDFPSSITPDLQYGVYLQRRMAQTTRMPELPASAQFDLARSNVPDSALRDLGPWFGQQPRQSWGFRDGIDNLVKNDPATVPVDDLMQFQRNLITAGYLPPNTPVTGAWDSEFAGAVSQFEQDNREQFYSGHHPGSIPGMAAVAQLGNIMPSRVFQGLVGAAKGLVLQTPETAERVGLAGGAVAGAAIGASVGSVVPGVGTAIAAGAGALIGAGVGFFSDLLHHDEDEKNQSFFSQFVDALSPWEEYSANPKAFWEDLGWVATASSVAMGVGYGVSAAAGGLGAISAEVAGGTDVLTATMAKGTVENAGWLPRLAGQPLKLLGAEKYEGWLNLTKTYGLQAQWTRPLIGKVTVPMFTGLSSAQMGARLFAGFGAGGNDIIDNWEGQFKIQHGRSPSEEERDKFAAKHAPTTIEQAIAGAPRPQSGIDIPFVGDIVDLPGFVIYPTNLLPWRVGDWSAAISTGLKGTESWMRPFVEAVSETKGVFGAEAHARTLEMMGENDAERIATAMTYSLNMGSDMEATRLVAAKGIERWDVGFERAYRDAKYQINSKLIAEAGEDPTLAAAKSLKRIEAGEKNDSTLDELMSWSVTDPLAGGAKGPQTLRGYIVSQEAREAGSLERGSNFLKANDITKTLTQEVREKVRYPTSLEGRGIGPGKVLPEEQFSIDVMKSDIKQLSEDIRKRTEIAAEKTVDPTRAQFEFVKLKKDEERLGQMEERLKQMQKYRKATWEDRAIVAERLDTPTAKDFYSWRKEYQELNKKLQQSVLDDNAGQVQVHRQEIRDWAEKHAAFLKPKDIDRAITGQAPDVRAIVRHLNAKAKGAAQDVMFDDETMTKLSELGYKPIVARANNVFMTADKHLTEVLGMGDYSRRANMWRSLGLGLDKDSNMAIHSARVGHTKWEVSEWLRGHGKSETSEQIYDRLWTALRGKRAGHVVTNESIRAHAPWADEIVTGSGFLKFKDKLPGAIAIDIRDLTPPEVFEAVKDMGYSYKEAEGLYNAIKRGHALGADFQFAHPIQSGHLLARNMRVSGLPGIADALRTWHAEGLPVPTQVKGVRAVYKIPEDIARSTEAQRVSSEVRTAAVQAGLGSDESTMLEQGIHLMLRAQVDAGFYPSVDEAASRLKVGWAEQFVNDGKQYMFKRIWRGASFEDVDNLVAKYNNTGEFSAYAASRDAVQDVFGGQWITLGDGSVQPLDDIMLQLIAATSPLNLPVTNTTFALKAVKQHMIGEPIRGVSRAGKAGDEIAADILSGHTMRQWSPELQAQREKTFPFYKALAGDPDALVIDRRIKVIHGLDPNSAVPKDFRAELEVQYDAMAEKYNIPRSSVQASVWVGFVDFMKEQAGIVRRQGDTKTAEHLESFVTDAARDNRGYDAILANPTKAQAEYIETIKAYASRTPPEVHFKRLAEDIQGSTTFGDDYKAYMQVYKTGDFNTFTHEFGHVLYRSLPDEQIAAIERMYKIPGAAPDFGEGLPVVESMEPYVDQIIAVTKANKGATWNPHDGSFYGGKSGYAVGTHMGTAIKIPPGASHAEIRSKLLDFFQDNPALRDPDMYVGTWVDDIGQIHIDPSKIWPEREASFVTGARNRQEAIYGFAEKDAFAVPDKYPRGAAWSPEASEKFSLALEQYFRKGIADSQQKKGIFEAIRRRTGNTWLHYRGYVEDQNLVHPELKRMWDGYFKDMFETAGSEPIRGLWRPGTRAVAGAGAGAALGGIYGDEKMEDAIKGAALGAAGGLAVNLLLKRSYGYLPDYLLKVGSALRFTLSPAFDARRFTKGQLLAMMNKEELPYMGVANRYIKNREWPSLLSKGTTISGDQAWKEAMVHWNDINRVGYLEDVDTFERTLTANGILGYNPRQREIAYSYMLAQKGRSPTQIRKTMSEVFSYGYGRTAMEKSVNFMFFPFSFEKKLLTTVGDFLFQAPGRALLLHEGLRRYKESKLDDTISGFLDKHVPMLQELEAFNAFAHGIGPGRFLLEGLFDHRTKTAEAAQVLSTFFLAPGGAALTPLAQQIGGFGDMAVHAFVPIALTGQAIMERGGDLHTGTGVDQALRSFSSNYIPFIGDLSQFFTAAHDQAIAIVEGEAPWAQLNDYLDETDRYKGNYADIARYTGHSSVDGYFQSADGYVAAQQYEQKKQELRDKYPTGFEMSTGFEDSSQLADHALYQVVQKVASGQGDRAEDAMAQLAQMDQQATLTASTLTTVDPQVLKDISARSIRSYALKYVSDAHFVELWNQLLAWKYGPLTVVAA